MTLTQQGVRPAVSMPHEQRSDEREKEHAEGLVEQDALLAKHVAKCRTDYDKLATKRDALRASVAYGQHGRPHTSARLR